jgi:uncharacterized protein (TIGR02246 family)
MGEARQVADRMTEALFTMKDIKAVAECYAPDAVAVTPDEGELRGRDAIAEYHRKFIDAFPDVRYQHIAKHDSGNSAIDEGTAAGTHTGTLYGPDGTPVPATGRAFTLRAMDVCTVENARIVRHHFYFDQLEFLRQLGLTPETSR